MTQIDDDFDPMIYDAMLELSYRIRGIYQARSRQAGTPDERMHWVGESVLLAREVRGVDLGSKSAINAKRAELRELLVSFPENAAEGLVVGQLGGEELRPVFADEIWPQLLACRLEPGDAQPRPARFVSVGGQPGCGKGRIMEKVGRMRREAVVVNGDELRFFHPGYTGLMIGDPLRMPEVTASASGTWVGMATEAARGHRISAIVETTLRQPDVLLREFAAFREAGFETEMRVVAVPLEVSRCATVTRYLEQVAESGVGRWTPGAHHDLAAEALPGTVKKLVESGLVDYLMVVDRAGEVLFETMAAQQEAAVVAGQVVEVIGAARDVAAMSPADAKSWLRRVGDAIRESARLGVGDPDVTGVLGRMVSVDAQLVAVSAYPGDQDSQRRSLAQLQRLLAGL